MAYELWSVDESSNGVTYRRYADVETMEEGKREAVACGDGTYALCVKTGNVARIDVVEGKAYLCEDDALEDREDA